MNSVSFPDLSEVDHSVQNILSYAGDILYHYAKCHYGGIQHIVPSSLEKDVECACEIFDNLCDRMYLTLENMKRVLEVEMKQAAVAAAAVANGNREGKVVEMEEVMMAEGAEEGEEEWKMFHDDDQVFGSLF